MTFNENARIDTSKVQRRSGGRRGGRRTATIGGGSLIGVILIVVVSQLFGVDLTPLTGMVSDTSSSTEQTAALENCETGADANENDDCRMAAAANSLDVFWQDQFSSGYRAPGVVLYSGTTSSACGSASSSIGPFYCPADESIYMDTDFFSVLRTDFGASGGPLAQMYVMAHEWGHHISNITGDLQQVGRETGPTSGSVRLELQADCYAGAWVRDASSTLDAQGTPFMKPVSAEEIADAMNAAAVVGDDHIQRQSGQQINPDGFTHGSSEQRQKWFQTGYRAGSSACDTFSVPAHSL